LRRNLPVQQIVKSHSHGVGEECRQQNEREDKVTAESVLGVSTNYSIIPGDTIYTGMDYQ
jgi:hypothetical protein